MTLVFMQIVKSEDVSSFSTWCPLSFIGVHGKEKINIRSYCLWAKRKETVAWDKHSLVTYYSVFF